MTTNMELWGLMEQSGVQIQPREDKKRGFCWKIEGIQDWSDPLDTKEDAAAAAFMWLVQQARLLRVVDQVALNSSTSDYAVWRRLIKRAGKENWR